jgi:carbon monoxide dehydrogenase subunit G
LVIAPQERTLAQKRFVVAAPQRRVWGLLAKVTYQQLPLEKVEILGFDGFRAVLKWRIGFLSLSFNVAGKIVDVVEPSSYGCVILVKKGPIQAGVRVVMTLKAVDEAKTEVLCTAREEAKRNIRGWVLRGQQRNFALSTFDSIAARIHRLFL